MNNIKKWFIILSFCYFSSSVKADLRVYTNDAIENNILLRSLKENQDSFEYKYDASVGFWVPVFNVSNELKNYGLAEKSNNDETTLKISSRIGGSDILPKINDSFISFQNSKIEYEKEKVKLENIILENAFSTIAYKDVIDQILSQRESSYMLVNNIRNNVEAGIASESDLEQAKLLIEKINSDIDKYKNQINIFQSKIREVSGSEYLEFTNNDRRFFDDIFTYDISKMNRIENNFDLRIALNEKTRTHLKKEEHLTKWNVDLFVEKKIDSMIVGEKGEDSEVYVGLNASLTFPSYISYKESQSNAKLYSASKYRFNWLKTDLENKLDSLKSNLNFDKNELSSLNEQLSTIDRINRSFIQDFESGRTGYYEMLSNERERITVLSEIVALKVKIINRYFEGLTLVGGKVFDS